MVHFIIINWFGRSGVQIWNRVWGGFKWILWRVNLNITIVNGKIIMSPYDSQDHMYGFGRRGTGCEVNCWRFSVPLYWWISCFITMKGVELVNISSKTWWDEFRATIDTVISVVSNSSTAFSNNILSNYEVFRNSLKSCCVIIGGRSITKGRERWPEGLKLVWDPVIST